MSMKTHSDKRLKSQRRRRYLLELITRPRFLHGLGLQVFLVFVGTEKLEELRNLEDDLMLKRDREAKFEEEEE